MKDLREKIGESLEAVQRKAKGKWEIGIILGTGLGQLARKVTQKKEMDYQEIPHFPHTTALTHTGRLILGKIGKKRVVAMEGRFHYYEGYSLAEVTYPVRVMHQLGCRALIVSNAAGGLNPNFSGGDLMVITDHINLMGVNPLIGPNEEWLGSRFPDMSEPYDTRLIRVAESVASSLRMKLHRGVYVGVTGPNLETKAEYRFLRQIGSDAVGMSTVPEVIVARHCGMRVLGISCITDLCDPDALEVADIEKIIRVAKASEPKLTKLVMKVIESL
ncbi:MAG: purine-nucleoside phosphorylase [Candidatus Omnitrophica bacterium]|nr:purine-nucleoside phosphorylase [Candidatus Omnitrophota bacterium]